jgi:hypothetical protein
MRVAEERGPFVTRLRRIIVTQRCGMEQSIGAKRTARANMLSL